jgi:hypothetical protein
MLFLAAAVLPALLSDRPAPAGCVAVPPPKIDYRPNVARATSSPWVNSNAWRFLRDPNAQYCLEAPGKLSALAAAEAFAYGVKALIRTAGEGVPAFQHMLGFLRELPEADLPSLANIGIVDDGSARTGELMNLLSRRNLLYRPVRSPDEQLQVNVTSTDRDSDPSKQAYAIRQKLGDGNRLLRLYGSEVVIGRLTGDGTRIRLHLVNYASRPVNGLRVRIAGRYGNPILRSFGAPDAKAIDFDAEADATEFTIVSMNEYAVIDLSR